MQLEMEKVTGSSMIAERGHDYIGNVLYVRFQNQSLYTYSDFPAGLFARWKEAPSAGKFFNEYILNQFPTEQIS